MRSLWAGSEYVHIHGLVCPANRMFARSNLYSSISSPPSPFYRRIGTTGQDAWVRARQKQTDGLWWVGGSCGLPSQSAYKLECRPRDSGLTVAMLRVTVNARLTLEIGIRPHIVTSKFTAEICVFPYLSHPAPLPKAFLLGTPSPPGMARWTLESVREHLWQGSSPSCRQRDL